MKIDTNALIKLKPKFPKISILLADTCILDHLHAN